MMSELQTADSNRDSTENHIAQRLSKATGIPEKQIAGLQIRLRSSVVEGALAQRFENDEEPEFRFLFYIYYSTFIHLAASAETYLSMVEIHRAIPETFLLMQRLFMEGTTRAIFCWDILGQLLKLAETDDETQEFDPQNRSMKFYNGVTYTLEALGEGAALTFNGEPWSLNERPGVIDWLRNRQVHDSFHYVLPTCEAISEDGKGIRCKWIVISPKTSRNEITALRRRAQELNKAQKLLTGQPWANPWARILQENPETKRMFFPNGNVDSDEVIEPINAHEIIRVLLLCTLEKVIPSIIMELNLTKSV